MQSNTGLQNPLPIRQLQIRKLVASYSHAITSIAKEGFEKDWSEAMWERLLKSSACQGVGCWIQTEREMPFELAGYLIYLKSGSSYDIVSIATKADFRRQGLAKKMLQVLLEHSQTEEIFLEVEESNVAAVSLYQSHGFSRTGVRKNYYGEGKDAITMTWKRAPSLVQSNS